jgi:hypothetical protein
MPQGNAALHPGEKYSLKLRPRPASDRDARRIWRRSRHREIWVFALWQNEWPAAVDSVLARDVRATLRWLN